VAGLLDPEKTEAIKQLPKTGEAPEPQFGQFGVGPDAIHLSPFSVKTKRLMVDKIHGLLPL